MDRQGDGALFSPRLEPRPAAGEADAEGAPAPRLALHGDAPVVRLDDAVGDRQAEAGAAAAGGEEGVEDLV